MFLNGTTNQKWAKELELEQKERKRNENQKCRKNEKRANNLVNEVKQNSIDRKEERLVECG